MKDKAQQIIEDAQRLCRESWEARKRAIRAVEETKALSDQVWENIRKSRKEIKRLLRKAEGHLKSR